MKHIKAIVILTVMTLVLTLSSCAGANNSENNTGKIANNLTKYSKFDKINADNPLHKDTKNKGIKFDNSEKKELKDIKEVGFNYPTGFDKEAVVNNEIGINVPVPNKSKLDDTSFVVSEISRDTNSIKWGLTPYESEDVNGIVQAKFTNCISNGNIANYIEESMKSIDDNYDSQNDIEIKSDKAANTDAYSFIYKEYTSDTEFHRDITVYYIVDTNIALKLELTYVNPGDNSTIALDDIWYYIMDILGTKSFIV